MFLKNLIPALILSMHFQIHPLVLEKNTLENTNWRGTNCSSFADGIFQGTYNYRFLPNENIETYLEYYTDLIRRLKSSLTQVVLHNF